MEKVMVMMASSDLDQQKLFYCLKHYNQELLLFSIKCKTFKYLLNTSILNYTSSGRCLEIRRLRNGFRKIVLTDGRSLLNKTNKYSNVIYYLILPWIMFKHGRY